MRPQYLVGFVVLGVALNSRTPRIVPTESSRDPLLGDIAEDPEDQRAKVPEEHQAAISIPQLFTAPELRKPLIIVCFSMLCQQLSGLFRAICYTGFELTTFTTAI